MRPVLRPGLRLLRDLSGRMAVVDRERVYRLDDVTARLLDRLDGLADQAAALGEDPDVATLTAWSRLREGGVVVDVDAPARLVRGVEAPPGADPLREAAALVAEGPDTAQARWLARRRAAVAVTGRGAAAAGLTALLRQAGVGTLDTGARCAEADLAVLTHDHEPPTDMVERLMRDDRPHLPAGTRGTDGVVGPFVLPGTTPCLRCVDLTRCQTDPGWAAVRDQLSSPDRTTHLSTAASGVAIHAVAALAAAEVLARIEGRVPATVGATATISAQDPLPTLRRWPTQPACGCTWQTSAPARGQ